LPGIENTAAGKIAEFLFFTDHNFLKLQKDNFKTTFSGNSLKNHRAEILYFVYSKEKQSTFILIAALKLIAAAILVAPTVNQPKNAI
jgi:hypothetical protein